MIDSEKPSDSISANDNPIESKQRWDKDDDLGLRPMTIAQMCKALKPTSPDGSFTFDGVPFKYVTFVGCVLDITQNVTHTVYKVYDGNSIDARFWLDDRNTGAVDDAIQCRVYARFNGYLSIVGDSPHFIVRSAHRLDDYMEIDFHYLECMALLARQEASAAANKAFPESYAAANNAYLPAPKKAGDSKWARLPALQRAIVELLAGKAELKDGFHVAGIAKELKGADIAGASDSKEINAAIDALLDDGLVYSTIDESHLKAVT